MYIKRIILIPECIGVVHYNQSLLFLILVLIKISVSLFVIKPTLRNVTAHGLIVTALFIVFVLHSGANVD